MPFTLLPAIDLTDGGLGVYTPTGPTRLDAFGGDPLLAARSCLEAGARWLHVVDMDLAFGETETNLEVVRAIAALPGATVQASGGVRTWGEIGALLEAGASRVVVSSAALLEEDLVAEILARARPGEVVFGIEVADGRIRARGAEAVDLDLMSTLGWLRTAGAPGFLVTAVERVGRESGPDTELVRRVARAGVPTTGAGGIRSVADLAAVRDAGAIGAVVGRSAMDGSLDLGEALLWAAV
ncbi:MAG: HisA/HisF-related TIM barrel protein [Actinomycetota bacterium]|jgi:phosphoribosylformimino-5-aminoimidazole carboxamide ribonucleotide (ProFAR) isomerase